MLLIYDSVHRMQHGFLSYRMQYGVLSQNVAWSFIMLYLTGASSFQLWSPQVSSFTDVARLGIILKNSTAQFCQFYSHFLHLVEHKPALRISLCYILALFFFLFTHTTSILLHVLEKDWLQCVSKLFNFFDTFSQVKLLPVHLLMLFTHTYHCYHLIVISYCYILLLFLLLFSFCFICIFCKFLFTQFYL